MNSSFAHERMVRNYMKGVEDKLIKKLKTKSNSFNEAIII